MKPGDLLANRILSSTILLAAVRAALELGVFDRMSETPRALADLANDVDCPPQGLGRLLRLLAVNGFVREPAKDQFSIDPFGDPLRRNAPDSERDWVWFTLLSYRTRALEHLADAIRHNRTVMEEMYGMGEFEYFATHPEFADLFSKAMVGVTEGMTRDFLSTFSLEGFTRIADIGGGNGQLIAAILRDHPTVTGILLDLPHTAQAATAYLTEAGVVARCQFVGGSFLDSVPSGADLYILKSVLHNWSDEQAALILRNVRGAMGEHSRVLLIESLLPPGLDPSFPFSLDLCMLAFPGGRERTQAEYETLLRVAGFRVSRVISMPPRSLIEATPA
jgi:C-methyltransferase